MNSYAWHCTQSGKFFKNGVALCNVMYLSIWQLWTVALWLTQPMAKLVIPVEQHLDRQRPTVVIQATTWWETVIIHAELQECGLVVHLPVKVRCYWRYLTYVDIARSVVSYIGEWRLRSAWYTLIMQVSFLGVLKLGRSALPSTHCFYMTVALFVGLHHFI